MEVYLGPSAARTGRYVSWVASRGRVAKTATGKTQTEARGATAVSRSRVSRKEVEGER